MSNLSSFKHFKKFVEGKCTFGDVDISLCESFKEYLLSANSLKNTINKDIAKLDLIPLFHALWDAIGNDDFVYCIEIRTEINLRKLTNRLCPFSVMILKNSDYPLYRYLDDVYPFRSL